MREPKPEWVAALKAACGSNHDLRWNETAGRWEFIIPGADGVPRSQFWGQFFDRKGVRIEPDPVTGLAPFRDLDDEAMAEAIRNLEVSFVGNTRREMEARIRHNRETLRAKYRAAGEAFADLAAERGRRIRGAPLIHVPVTIGN